MCKKHETPMFKFSSCASIMKISNFSKNIWYFNLFPKNIRIAQKDSNSGNMHLEYLLIMHKKFGINTLKSSCPALVMKFMYIIEISFIMQI